MFRYERPQKGRLRQFHQIGVEFLGVDSSWADIELISMAQILFEELGMTPSIHLEINSLGDHSSRQSYRKALSLFLEKYKSHLSEDSLKRLALNPLRILDSKSEQDQELLTEAPQIENFFNNESQKIYEEICQGLKQIGIPYQKNSRLVRGLDYYTHCVFEFKSSSSDLGSQNTVLAGGRYNGLIPLMGGPTDTVGVGWAAGIERLNLILKETPPPPPFLSLIPIGKEAESLALKVLHELRAQGFHIDMIYTGNLNKRMKKAHKNGACGAIIIGQEEVKQKSVQLKNFSTGNQQSITLSQLNQGIRELTK